MKKVSRRDFLKGSLAGAAALTLSGIGVGGQVTAEAAEATAPAETYAPLEKIPAAYLNPQRTDYRSNT